jgi:RND family efflux transporter MFP subunit
MISAVRLRSLAGDHAWRVACGTALALALSGCNEQNAYVPPPPPKVDVALPLKQDVTPYLMATGNTATVNDTTLVARVVGFLQAINYKDGDSVKAGTQLFVIEQEPYQLALEQAQSAVSSADAAAKQSEANYNRTAELVKKGFATQQDLDAASAQQAADAARQKQSAVDVKQAQLNLSYTEVKAPFDGVVTARQISIGELVGGTTSTLATIVQLDPIYVDFNVSEKDVLRIRAEMAKRGITAQDLKKVPVEIGLQNETGYPHKGTLDYAAPILTASTGTLAVRAVLPNDGRRLLPGYFVRVRVPLSDEPDMLLVPDRAIGSDQSGRYLLVAGKDDVVEQRTVEIGQLVGSLRVIASGIKADDRIVISGLLSAVPGQKIEPQLKTVEASAAGGSAQ